MKKSISMLMISCFTVISAQQLDVVAGQPDFSDFPNICVDITVSDSTGNVVSGITNNMVTLFEDSVQNNSFNISSLRESGGGLSILIAVDASLSMRGEPIDSVKSALRNFINQLSEEDQLSIVAFHDDVEIISDFSSNKDSLLLSVDSINAIGKITELYYGIFSGLKQLSENKNLHDDKVLIVLSDGKDEGTAYSDDDCIEKANQVGIPVYAIGFHSTAEEKYLRVLERISDKTGGLYNDVKAANKLNLIYELVFNQIRGRYNLCFKTVNTSQDSLEHWVTVIIEKDQLKGQIQFVIKSPEKDEQNWLIIGGTVVLLIVISLIVTSRNRKAKEEEKKRLAEERSRIEADAAENMEEEHGSEDPAATKVHKPSDPRETVIAGHTSFQPLQFLFESGPLKGTSETINGDLSIGRSNSNNLSIDENTVSGNHCKITVEFGDFFIEDLKSTNGTKVNGARIEKTKIKSGDRIEIGAVTISVR